MHPKAHVLWQLQEMKGKDQPVKTNNAYMMGYGDVDVSWIKVSKCITGRTPEQVLFACCSFPFFSLISLPTHLL